MVIFITPITIFISFINISGFRRTAWITSFNIVIRSWFNSCSSNSNSSISYKIPITIFKSPITKFISVNYFGIFRRTTWITSFRVTFRSRFESRCSSWNSSLGLNSAKRRLELSSITFPIELIISPSELSIFHSEYSSFDVSNFKLYHS